MRVPLANSSKRGFENTESARRITCKLESGPWVHQLAHASNWGVIIILLPFTYIKRFHNNAANVPKIQFQFLFRSLEVNVGHTWYAEKLSPQRESITVTESTGTRLCWVKGHHSKSFDFLCILFNLWILVEWKDCKASLSKPKTEDDSENQSVRSSDGSSGTGGKTSTGTLNNTNIAELWYLEKLEVPKHL